MASIPPVIEVITVTGLSCYPEPVDAGGTISTSGVTATGVGTTFTDYRMGDSSFADFFLYNESTGEIRSVKSINSDTQLILNEAFTTPMSGGAFMAVSNSLGNYNKVEVYDTAGAVNVFLVDGVSFAVTATKNSPLVLDSNGRGIPAFAVSGACKVVIYH